jgi:outer membrane lipoprotein-sorting protein
MPGANARTTAGARRFARRRLLRGAVAGGLAWLMACGLGAGGAEAATLTLGERSDLARIETYLNDIRTMRARFEQFSTDGQIARGSLYLRRPGRLRVEYEPPVSVLLVADGLAMTYYDSELDQLSQAPLYASPVWFLLRDPIRIDEDITVTGVERATGVIRVSMYQTDEPDAGRVTLTFSDQPLELRNWRIIDAQGKIIDVALHDVRLGGELANELFATPTKRERIETR